MSESARLDQSASKFGFMVQLDTAERCCDMVAVLPDIPGKNWGISKEAPAKGTGNHEHGLTV